MLIREQNLEKKEQIDSEKIDSTHFERQEDFSIASGERKRGCFSTAAQEAGGGAWGGVGFRGSLHMI